MKIRHKLIGYFLAVAIVPVLIVAYLSFNSAQKIIEKQIFSHLTTATILKEEELKDWFNRISNSFNRILHDMEEESHIVFSHQYGHDRSDEGGHEKMNVTRNQFLIDALNRYAQFDELFLIEISNGEVHLSSDERQMGKIKTEQLYFQQGKKSFYISDIYHSTSLGKNSLIIAAPLNVKGREPVFVFAARVKLDDIDTLMSERGGLGKTGETYLVNNFNLFVSQREFRGYGVMGVFSDGVKDCLNGNSGTGVYRGYRQEIVLGSYRWIPTRQLCVVAEIDQSEALEPVAMLKQTIIIITLAILIIIFFIGYFLSDSLTNPIKQLTKFAKAVSGGNLAKKLNTKILKSKDEIGILGNALSKMTNNLISSFDQVNLILQTMPGAFLVFDENGYLVMANQSVCTLGGYTKKQITKKTFKDIFLMNDLDFSFNLLKEKGFMRDIIADFKPKRGKKIPVNIAGGYMKETKTEGGGGYLFIAHDLREQRKYASRRADEIALILNRISVGDFSEEIKMPEKEDEFTDLIVAIDLMSRNLENLIKEDRRKTVKLEASQKELQASHKYLERAKISIEQEKAKTDALIADIGEGILVIDLKGNIIFMNPGAEVIFSKSADKILGLSCNEYLNFEDKNGRKISFDKILTSKKKAIFTNLYFVKNKQVKIPLATTISPFMFNGKLLGIVGVFRDITKEKEIDKAKSEFVSLTSHQLQTPLTAIKWFLEIMMKKEKLSKRQFGYIKEAFESNERMIRLVDDFLNVSRLEASSISVVPQEKDFVNFVDAYVHEARVVAKKRHQTIKFNKPSGKINISFDPDLIGQVVSNLISNAMHYSDDRTLIIVSVRKKGNQVKFNVQDNGIGIPKEFQTKLFSKFSRTKEASLRSTTGSGLGLYITKKILDVCHGTIKCSSKVGKGSTFIVDLPLKSPVVKGEKKLIEQRFS